MALFKRHLALRVEVVAVVSAPVVLGFEASASPGLVPAPAAFLEGRGTDSPCLDASRLGSHPVEVATRGENGCACRADAVSPMRRTETSGISFMRTSRRPPTHRRSRSRKPYGTSRRLSEPRSLVRLSQVTAEGVWRRGPYRNKRVHRHREGTSGIASSPARRLGSSYHNLRPERAWAALEPSPHGEPALGKDVASDYGLERGQAVAVSHRSATPHRRRRTSPQELRGSGGAQTRGRRRRPDRGEDVCERRSSLSM
jgi:hypothetical protein